MAPRNPTTLLDLPNELLDMVCEFAVVEVDGILITPILRQPALSQVCRRLRNLTVPIWYTKNVFEHEYYNFDRALGVKFARVAEGKSIDVDCRILCCSMEFDENYDEQLSYDNLVEWARLHYERPAEFRYESQLIGHRKGSDDDGLEHIEGPRAHWFSFLYADWRYEWLRAGKDRAKMTAWDAKKPVIEAALKLCDIREFIPWSSW